MSNIYRTESGERQWRQSDEWAFIRSLGSHAAMSLVDQRCVPTRLELLRGYHAGLELRADFEGLDRAALLAAVEGEIRLEEARNNGAGSQRKED